MSYHTLSRTCLACSKATLWYAEAFQSPSSSLTSRLGSLAGHSLHEWTLPKLATSRPSTLHNRMIHALCSTTAKLSKPGRSTLCSLRGTPATSFDDGERPYHITTPIYYVNDKPHIGHAYTSVAADVLAQYMRLSGRKVLFQTGTDEHGEKVQLSAMNRGVDTQEFVDTVSQNFRDMSTLLNLELDCFVRTTDEHHKKAVQHLWNVLMENDYIYLGTYEGWYSVRDECFYTESELVDGKAPTGADVVWVAKEPSYFFRLSNFQQKLLDYYEENPDFIAPEARRNEVVSFVKSGLRDLSVSRTSFSWGVPVPGDDKHVMYVWVDALTNYISTLGYPNQGEGSQMSEFWPASLHIVGKDILRFHAVYWPAMLMAAGLPVPRRLYAHGWWTKDGQKISKSIGNVIDPVELVAKYGVDQTRFFLMSEVNFGNDGDFSDKAFVLKVNTNLANELGNLCQRTLSLVYKNCDAKTPIPGTFTSSDEELLAAARTVQEKTGAAIATQALQKYVEGLVQVVWDANKYIDEMAPWALRKTSPERMATVLYVIMEVLRYVAILYQPLIPASANSILDQLGVPQDQRTFVHLSEDYAVEPGTQLQKPQGVFPRLEVPVEELVES